ncbi:MAG TPA: hypothetical protein VIM12_13525 [Noviherbaspirillum sp.]|jgi:hypothetical protein|uniref:hypothetical protein n=1 Tax=Noviherbaspirillum sp. TaxID=1926288 RepID=UPI002F948CFC
MNIRYLVVCLAGLHSAAGAADWGRQKEYALSDAEPVFEIERVPFGSGTPSEGYTSGTETARIVRDGLYHVPNHLPGYPTAATLWPREVPVACGGGDGPGSLSCEGYRIHPTIGRGEYLFVRPYVRQAPPPKPVEAAPPPEPPVTRKKPLG